ncbi:MAG TPA: CoA pyrophosphatase [Thermoanaerobaculia bacterium]|nr:CoA pyrophosphatase [Thermoanaerobaculia bacterium]
MSVAARDPRLRALRRVLARHAPRRAPRGAETLEAGVSLVLRPGAADLELLLIERVERPGDPWSGHMALPGGMRERTDADLRATAFRETAEEVGVALDDERLLGALDEVAPSSPRLPPLVISPWVAAVAPGTPLVPDPAEVATALWVPLAELRGEGAVSEVLVELEGSHRSFPSLRYLDYQIWGLTYRILRQFMALTREVWEAEAGKAEVGEGEAGDIEAGDDEARGTEARETETRQGPGGATAADER